MTSDIIKRIRAKQAGMNVPAETEPPLHQPEMLLIGCIDARLNISTDVGIPYGKALIYRNIAALVSGTRGEDDPEHVSEAAALEFAINVMQVKDLVVMGHTDCSGIRACLHGMTGMSHVMQHLAPLSSVRDEVTAQGGTPKQQARAMEQAAVRNSVSNLMTYSAVADAVKQGRLTLHGWVIDTGSARISEMDVKTGEFRPMGQECAA